MIQEVSLFSLPQSRVAYLVERCSHLFSFQDVAPLLKTACTAIDSHPEATRHLNEQSIRHPPREELQLEFTGEPMLHVLGSRCKRVGSRLFRDRCVKERGETHDFAKTLAHTSGQ